jgi:hypothetical protein
MHTRAFLLAAVTSLLALTLAAPVPSPITPKLEPLPNLIRHTAHNISAGTIDPAVRFAEYQGRECGGWEEYYQGPDGDCFLLPTGRVQDSWRLLILAEVCLRSLSTSFH